MRRRRRNRSKWRGRRREWIGNRGNYRTPRKRGREVKKTNKILVSMCERDMKRGREVKKTNKILVSMYQVNLTVKCN